MSAPEAMPRCNVGIAEALPTPLSSHPPTLNASVVGRADTKRYTIRDSTRHKGSKTGILLKEPGSKLFTISYPSP